MVTSPIANIIPCSFLDFPGKVAAVLFLRACNFSCPYCHNYMLNSPEWDASFGEIFTLEQMRKLLPFLDGCVISGGEPTMHREFLEQLLLKIKSLGLSIKLDTNGSEPLVLESLIGRGLIDYVAMDLKAPFTEGAYSRATGVFQSRASLSRIKNSMVVMERYRTPCTFRTTVVPGTHQKEDILSIAREVPWGKEYILQDFEPANAMDPVLRATKGYGGSVLREWAEEARKFVKKVTVLARD